MARNTISIAILANAAQARRELKSTTAEVEKAGSAWSKTNLTLAGTYAAAMTVAKKSFDRFSEVASEVKQVQRVLGGTAEEASRLRYAAGRVGISADDLSKGLGLLSKHLVANDAAAKALGISFRDSAGNLRPMNEILPEVMDRFAKMPAGAAKSALALQVFGKNGLALLPFLNKGAEGLAELSAQSDEYGLTLSGSALKASTEMAQAQKDLKDAMDGVKISVGQALVPAMKDVAVEAKRLAPYIGKVTEAVASPEFLAVATVLVGIRAAMAAVNVVTGIWAGLMTVGATATSFAAKAQVALAAAFGGTAATGTLATAAEEANTLAEEANALAAETLAATQAELAAARAAGNLVTAETTAALAANSAAMVANRDVTIAASVAMGEYGAAIAGVNSTVGILTKSLTVLAGLGAGYGIGTILNNKLGISDKISDGWDWIKTLGGAKTEADDAAFRAQMSALKLAAKQAQVTRDARAWVAATRGQSTADLMTDDQAIKVYTDALHGGVAKVREWEAAQKKKAAADEAAAKAAKAASQAAKEDASIAGSNAYRKINDQFIKRMQALKDQLDAAVQHVQDLTQKRDDYAGQLADLVRGGTVTDIPLVRAIASLDGRTVNVTTGAQAFRDGLAARLKAAKDFVANMAALQAKGVSADILQQIAEAGPQQGGALAAALKGATATQVREINGMQSQLTATANQFGQTFAKSIYDPQIKAAQATVAALQLQSVAAVKDWINSLSVLWQKGGTDLAKQLYQAGVNIADGLVEGIQSQKTAVTKQADDLATWLLTIKSRLGIQSPSRVFHSIGRNIGLGLVGGVDSTQSAVHGSMARLTTALGNGVQMPKLQLLQGGQASPTYNIDVRVAATADQAEIGRQVLKAIEAHERSTGVRRLAS